MSNRQNKNSVHRGVCAEKPKYEKHERVCFKCGKPLNGYNKTGICMSHSNLQLPKKWVDE